MSISTTESIYYEIVKAFVECPNTKDVIKNYLKMYEDSTEILNDYKRYASWTIKYKLLGQSVTYLINRERTRKILLLDLASGRGNDLNRWIKLKIPNVLGIEVDKGQYDVAVKRNNKRSATKVEYVHGSALDKSLVKDSLNRLYKKDTADIITCNFAMNYFFKNEQTINDFFETVSSCMAPNSLFVGTAADGDIIEELLRICGTIDTNLYFLKKSDESDNGYDISIKTPYFQSLEEREEGEEGEEGEGEVKQKIFTEFFIHKKELVTICKKYRLIPVKLGGCDPVCNFTSIRDTEYDKYGPTIRAMFFRFSFIKF